MSQADSDSVASDGGRVAIQRKIASDVLTQCRDELGIADYSFEPIHFRLAVRVWHRFVLGIPSEMFLYANRGLITGEVLDVASHRFLREWIYDLAAVREIQVCGLEAEMVYDLERFGAGTFRTSVDYVEDLTQSEISIPEDSFDTVLCTSVLEHCQDPKAMLKTLYALLRVGGTLLLNVPHVAPEHGPVDLWRFTNMGLKYLALSGGFADQHIRTGSVLHFDEEWTEKFGERPLARVFAEGKEHETRRACTPYLNYLICTKG